MGLPDRRDFLRGGLALAGLGLLAGCGIGSPPAPPVQVRRIGVLGDAPASVWDAFREGMGEHGWVEGQNLAIERRWAEGSYERYVALTRELAGLPVECIVAGSLSAVSAAKRGTSTVPIVGNLVTGEALENGIVENIARPGGNITGSAGISGAQLFGKLLELLAAVAPGATLIAALGNSTSSGFDYGAQAARSAAAALGLELQVFSVRGTDELEGAFAALGAAGAHALAMIHSTIFASARPRLAELALRHRLPSVTNDTELPAAGGLLAYGVNRDGVYRRAANYVDRILKGAKPGDLPMERPTTFDLSVNLKTAQALGLTIPKSILEQATEVLQ